MLPQRPQSSNRLKRKANGSETLLCLRSHRPHGPIDPLFRFLNFFASRAPYVLVISHGITTCALSCSQTTDEEENSSFRFCSPPQRPPSQRPKLPGHSDFRTVAFRSFGFVAKGHCKFVSCLHGESSSKQRVSQRQQNSGSLRKA